MIKITIEGKAGEGKSFITEKIYNVLSKTKKRSSKKFLSINVSDGILWRESSKPDIMITVKQ